MQLVPSNIAYGRVGHSKSKNTSGLGTMNSIPVKFYSEDGVAAAEEIEAFERDWGIKLPFAYKEFLMIQNGGQPDPNYIRIPGNNSDFDIIEINSMFGLHRKNPSCNLEDVYHTLPRSVPLEILPIALVPWESRKLVLDLRDGGEEVKFWDSAKFWGNNVWKEDYLYPVAKDFATLLTMFVTEDEAMDQSMQPLSEFLD